MEQSPMFARIFAMYAMFVVTVYLAFVLMPDSVYNHIFSAGDGESDGMEGMDNGEDESGGGVGMSLSTDTGGSRYSQLTKTLLVFLVGVCVCAGLLCLAAFGAVYAHQLVRREDTDPRSTLQLARELFTFLTWRWDALDGSATLLPFYIALGYVLLVMAAFYMVYFKCVSSYFEGMRYTPCLTEDDESDGKTEYATPRKFVWMYGLSMCGMLLFCVLLLAFHTVFSVDKGSFAVYAGCITVLLGLTVGVFRWQMRQRSLPKFAFLAVLVTTAFSVGPLVA